MRRPIRNAPRHGVALKHFADDLMIRWAGGLRGGAGWVTVDPYGSGPVDGLEQFYGRLRARPCRFAARVFDPDFPPHSAFSIQFLAQDRDGRLYVKVKRN